ncbi:unnamed protein product [Choristocarpus tenellus]
MSGVRLSDVELNPCPHVDPSDKSDPVAWMKSKEQAVREEMIAKERFNLLRLKIVDCYRKEGVNHYVNCKELTTKYAALMKSKTYGVLKPPSGNGDEDE